MDYYADLGIEIDGFAKGGMPAKNKKNFTHYNEIHVEISKMREIKEKKSQKAQSFFATQPPKEKKPNKKIRGN